MELRRVELPDICEFHQTVLPYQRGHVSLIVNFAQTSNQNNPMRPSRIELPPPAWQASILPVYDSRKKRPAGLEPATSTLARSHATIAPWAHGSVGKDFTYISGISPVSYILDDRQNSGGWI